MRMAIHPSLPTMVPVYASCPGIIINRTSVHFQMFPDLSLTDEEPLRDLKYELKEGDH